MLCRDVLLNIYSGDWVARSAVGHTSTERTWRWQPRSRYSTFNDTNATLKSGGRVIVHWVLTYSKQHETLWATSARACERWPIRADRALSGSVPTLQQSFQTETFNCDVWTVAWGSSKHLHACLPLLSVPIRSFIRGFNICTFSRETELKFTATAFFLTYDNASWRISSV